MFDSIIDIRGSEGNVIQDRINRLIIVLFGLFPLIPNNLKGIPVILFLMAGIWNLRNNIIIGNYSEYKKSYKLVFIQAIPFLVLIPSYFYSSDLEFYFGFIVRSLSLLIVPISFFLLSTSRVQRYVELFKKVFVTGVIVFCGVLFFYIFYNDSTAFNQGIFNVNFLRVTVGDIPFIGTHAIYASVYIGIAILFILGGVGWYLKVYNWIFLVVLTFFISLIASKMALVSLSLIIGIYLFQLMPNRNSKIIAFTSLIFASYLFVTQVPMVYNRFKEVTSINTYKSINENNSTSIRVGILNCSIDLLKENWIWGYGVGDVKQVFRDCYKGRSSVLLDGNYNSHNQYISYWLATGLLGVVLFMSTIVFNVNLAIKKRDLTFMYVVLFYTLNLLTENLLERRSGVILYSFIVNLFAWSDLLKDDG